MNIKSGFLFRIAFINQILLLSILLANLCSHNATAQESRADTALNPTDKKSTEQNLSHPTKHFGGYGAFSITYTNFNKKATPLLGARGGIIINHRIAIGLEYNFILPVNRHDILLPTGIPDTLAAWVFGGLGGILIEPILLSNRLVHVTFPLCIGFGGVGYLRDWEVNPGPQYVGLIDQDLIWYIKPGVNIELNVSHFFRLDLGVNYRIVQDLTLVNTSSDAFSGFSLMLLLKFGSF